MIILDFNKIKYYYDTFNVNGERLWTKEMVYDAVGKGKITAEEYKLITGEDYIV